uniref:Uncharacterized protein n=1 Tax=Glossina austeni TaxID=7395 RepID=A0A1A9URG2_GLOAU
MKIVTEGGRNQKNECFVMSAVCWRRRQRQRQRQRSMVSCAFVGSACISVISSIPVTAYSQRVIISIPKRIHNLTVALLEMLKLDTVHPSHSLLKEQCFKMFQMLM